MRDDLRGLPRCSSYTYILIASMRSHTETTARGRITLTVFLENLNPYRYRRRRVLYLLSHAGTTTDVATSGCGRRHLPPSNISLYILCLLPFSLSAGPTVVYIPAIMCFCKCILWQFGKLNTRTHEYSIISTFGSILRKKKIINT